MGAQPKRKSDASNCKVERLEARISTQEKAMFAKAAAIQGRSLTEFVVSSLHEVALRTIESYQVMRLAEQDQETFVGVMLNPPEPSETLKAAASRYFKHRQAR